MARGELQIVLDQLPRPIRETIEGYVDFAEEASEELFSEVGIARTDDLMSEFLFLCGLRRLWSLVDADYWILDNSLAITREFGIGGVRAGGIDYAHGTGFVAQLAELRGQLQAILDQADVLTLVRAQHLSEMLEMLSHRRQS